MLTENTTPAPSETERLAVAQSAVENYFATCFWFMAPSLVVTKEILPQVVKELRSHGDRRAFQIAQELCR